VAVDHGGGNRREHNLLPNPNVFFFLQFDVNLWVSAAILMHQLREEYIIGSADELTTVGNW